MKRTKTAKGSKPESRKERILKDPKDTKEKAAGSTAEEEARGPTKARPRKAKATGTTAAEVTTAEEAPMEAGGAYGGGYDRGGGCLMAAEVDTVKNENMTSNMTADPLMYKGRRCIAIVCAWAERDWHIVTNHDRDTCNHPGGDMYVEGYSRAQCIAAQRQMKDKYYQEEKRNRQPPPGTSPATPVHSTCPLQI